MIRIVCVNNNVACACNVGGPAETEYKTFDIDAPSLEAWLSHSDLDDKRFDFRAIVGGHVIEDKQNEKTDS